MVKKLKTKIDVGTTLAKILKKDGAEEILMKNGVPCLSCPVASLEIDNLKIGEVCKAYGLNLKKILKELNNN
jgi:hypothetical protein